MVNATIQENEQLHTKDEVSKAKLVHDVIKNSGYPSAGEAIHILTGENIHGIPQITIQDIWRASKVCAGPDDQE